MKKSRLLLVAGAVAVFLSAGSAFAAPVHGGYHSVPHHTVTYVQSSAHHHPRPGHHGGGHHNVAHHHHHHHHNNTAGNIILATALLVSAFM